MAGQEQSAHPIKDNQRQGTPGEKKRRRKRVLNKDRSALVASIASAVVLKDEDVFFLCNPDGGVPPGNHGCGLYYHDCRFLNAYELRVAGGKLDPLAAAAGAGFKAELELANPDLQLADGSLLQKEELGITWERVLDAAHTALYDTITFRNYTLRPVTLPITLRFGAAFEDLFAVRGMPAKARGKLHPPEWQGGALFFLYDGSDGLHRSLTVHLTPTPEEADPTTARLRLDLQPRESKQVVVALVLAESPHAEDVRLRQRSTPDPGKVAQSLRQSSSQWLEHQTRVQSDSRLLGRVLERSLRDLRMLRSRLDGHTFFAAGVPWYVTLFGRDSLISSLQTLAYEPEVAAHTLRLLARYQGDKVDDWRDEEPGKIMHELRVGELARTNEIPQTPYYGTIDATPLFLVLLARHAAWTGSLDLFQELRGPVDKALAWMQKYGDPQGWGYLAYQVKSKKGLGNQGWKDSGDSIVNADGSLAAPPIALAEVQGYAYLAKTGLADLYRRAAGPRNGEQGRAEQLLKEANDLRQRFNRDFWLEDRGTYALALQDGKKPCAVVSSNAGQVLWSGIADPDKAQKTAQRLLAEDTYSGWGIRTLSAQERRYNPIGYHLGTVWPHDNSLILAGLRRYELDDLATRVFGGIVEAATHFQEYRLPEVFAGFSREQFSAPVRYPVACHPQAWAAGAVPYMLEVLLGLVPEAFERRLRVVRPVLPELVNWVELRGLRVGSARTDLRFERSEGGAVAVKVVRVEGDLEVVPESAAPAG